MRVKGLTKESKGSDEKANNSSLSLSLSLSHYSLYSQGIMGLYLQENKYTYERICTPKGGFFRRKIKIEIFGRI